MKVIIPKFTREVFLTPVSISEEQVHDTLHNEDIKKIIKYGDYTIILFLKKFNGYSLLADGRWNPESKSLLLSAVYKIFSHILNDLNIQNLLLILQKFAQDFGYNIEIGDQYNKFIYYESKIPIKEIHSMEELMKFMRTGIKVQNLNQSKDNYAGFSLIKPNYDGNEF